MKTIKTTVYNFNELSDDAKQKAIDTNREINVDYEWWGSTYEDAENVGLKITSFDLDRNRHAEGNFTDDSYSVACQIVAEHGEMCATYKTAKEFTHIWEKAVKYYSDGIQTDTVADEKTEEFDEYIEEKESEFLENILEDYAIILQNEYEYLQSDEAISETLIAKEYEFTEDGKQF